MQPGQQKITQFDEVTSTQAGDVIPIVRGGQNKRISVENFTGVIPDGWVTPAEVWTFSSFGNNVGVITIPEGSLTRYPINTRVWFKQGTPTPTNKYGVVIAATATSITVRMLNDTLENLTIQQPVVSSILAPGTPDLIDFTLLPRAQASSSGSQIVSNTTGTEVQINLPSTVINKGHTISSNSITVSETGDYWVSGEVRQAESQNFFAVLRRNGATIAQLSFRATTTTARGYQTSTGGRLMPLTAGDVITLAYQNRDIATTINFALLSVEKR